MIETRIVLSTDKKFDTAKQALVHLWNTRETSELHEIIFRPYKARRSHEQNNLMWAVLTEISKQVKDETGKYYSPEVWHNYFKATILGKDAIIMDGKPELVQKSTTKLGTKEFSDYVTEIQAWAVDRGVKFHLDG